MNDNFKLFIETNRDKISIKKDSNDNIIGIYSLVPTTELNFNNTNCKIEMINNKLMLNTIDGYQYYFGFKQKDNLISNFVRKRNIIRKKFQSKKVSSIISFLKSKITFNKKNENEELIRSSNSVEDLKQIQDEIIPLIKKLDKIFNKYELDEKYKSDIDINNYKEEFKSIRDNFGDVVNKSDISELLNVKNKLVNLCGKIIEKEKQYENKESNNFITNGSLKTNEEDNKTIISKSLDSTKLSKLDIIFIDDAKAEGLNLNDPEFKQMLNERNVDKDRILNYYNNINTNQTNNIEIKKEENVIKNKIEVKEPKEEIETIESMEEISIARDDERKKQIVFDIEKSNKQINDIEENIKYFENRILQTDELIKTSNLDSIETKSYNKVKENYQEKLNNQKLLLEQAKNELKDNVNKLSDFMNEQVTYYIDGKPYKKATRAEIEKYKQQHFSDQKRKEDLVRQQELLKERQELEKKLKENYEELKSLTTFEDELLLSREEPTIEEIQDTIKRFHQ